MTIRICACGCDKELIGRQTKYATEECKKKAARATWIMKVYGLTVAQFEAIYEFQEGKCAICLREFKATPHIDHEHGGHVRGLVCAYCNQRVIGKLRDHETAFRLFNYLKEPPAVQALGVKIVAPGRPKKKRKNKNGTTKRNSK